jgi:hypothetical protein
MGQLMLSTAMREESQLVSMRKESELVSAEPP